MTEDSYVAQLGMIWGNLNSLEMLLRSKLAEVHPREALAVGQTFETLAVGDTVAETPLTNFAPLARLIAQFNATAPHDRKVDPRLADLRDALAHGRFWAEDGKMPLRLVKFDNPVNGTVRVTWAETLTDTWLSEQRGRVFDAILRASGDAPV